MISAPYLRIVHTWTCSAGHSITLDDKGWPQRKGFREAVLRAWAKCKDEKCPHPGCGRKSTYVAGASPADTPALVPAAPPARRNYGVEYDAMPCSPGGSVEARRIGSAKRRRKAA